MKHSIIVNSTTKTQSTIYHWHKNLLQIQLSPDAASTTLTQNQLLRTDRFRRPNRIFHTPKPPSVSQTALYLAQYIFTLCLLASTSWEGVFYGSSSYLHVLCKHFYTEGNLSRPANSSRYLWYLGFQSPAQLNFASTTCNIHEWTEKSLAGHNGTVKLMAEIFVFFFWIEHVLNGLLHRWNRKGVELMRLEY